MVRAANGAAGLLALPAGTKLLGEVIAWTCPGVSAKFAALLDALRLAGLDESVARALQPRHAFARACRKLSESCIIRQPATEADL